MPSNKPRVATYTTESNIRKLKVISAYRNKSMSEYLEFMIDRAIREYEQEHGEIELLEYMELTGDKSSLPHERHTENFD